MKSLLTHPWISHFEACARLIVGFSGGLDSTVLLHTLASLPSLHHKLLVVHINHGLSPNALAWQTHCAQFCAVRKLKFLAKTVDFDKSANLEEGARKARYAFFTTLLQAQDCLLLAHHVDDQAETILLHLFRGAGLEGLSGIPAQSSLGLGKLARPFLSHTRQCLEEYAAHHQLTWVDDESNWNTQYSRNFLRHELLPLIKTKWPKVVNNLARTANHCRQAQDNLQALASIDYEYCLSKEGRLCTKSLSALSLDRASNVLRFWLKKNKIRPPGTSTLLCLFHELLEAKEDALPLIAWSDIQVRRYQAELYLEKKEELSLRPIVWAHFPKPLKCKGLRLYAKPTNPGLLIPSGGRVAIRFREGGEHIVWRGQNKALKKLLQDWKIPPWQRKEIPLIYIDDKLAAVVGYAVSDLFFSREGWTIYSV